MANVERPSAADNDSFGGWTPSPSLPLRLMANGPSMSTAAGSTAAAAASAPLSTGGVPSGRGRRRHGRAELQVGDPLRSRVARRASVDRHGAPVDHEIGGKLHLAVIGLRQQRVVEPQSVDAGAVGQHDLDIVELDRAGRADAERLEQPVRSVEHRLGNPVRIDQPVGVLEGRRPVGPAAGAERRGKDAGIADAGAAKLDAARQQRQRADAEVDGPGFEHGRAVTLGLERDVGDFDRQELRAVDRNPRRPKHGVDIHARKAA